MKHRGAGRWEVAVALLRCLYGEFGPGVRAVVVWRLFVGWLTQVNAKT